MSASLGRLSVQQRLAQLMQRQRELRDLFAQSQASVDRAQELEGMLIEVSKEIAELEIQAGRAGPAQSHQ